jgi:exodeoxyribonuclease V alpha subunit
MKTINDVHLQFASFFDNKALHPYAYLLSKRLSEGHICIDVNDVFNAGLPFEFVVGLKKVAGGEPLLSSNPEERAPFIWHGNKLYLQRYFHYETSILKSIKRLVEKGRESKQERMSKLSILKEVLEKMNDNDPLDANAPKDHQTDWQLAAAVSAFLNNFTIVTGGPGTGKTTTVAKVLNLLFQAEPGLRVALAAPTGKAAMRMGESLKANTLEVAEEVKEKFNKLIPSTLHRLLGFKYNSIYFKHDEKNPLPYDVLVIDEASMIDVAMFAKMLDAVRGNTRVILLGDKNQLSSVEAGSLFGDLCKIHEQSNLFTSELINIINEYIKDAFRQLPSTAENRSPDELTNHIIELRKSRRFKEQSEIGKISLAVIQNDIPKLEAFIQQNQNNAVSIHDEWNEALLEPHLMEYTKYIQEEDIEKALKLLNQIRVLCAVREGDRGLYTINKKIEQFLKRKKIKNHDATLFSPDGDFYENRPVIVTQNITELMLFNGDTGIIRKDKSGAYKAWFIDHENKLRSVLPAYITDAETVFAMTIHKSQGSEYNKVVVILPENKEIALLTRELLYTAITRAKEKAVIFADKTTFFATAENKVNRASGIADRINELA